MPKNAEMNRKLSKKNFTQLTILDFKSKWNQKICSFRPSLVLLLINTIKNTNSQQKVIINNLT